MAIFDPILQRVCIRVVYDGAGGTGKTTNLRSLCTLFATQHTAELFSPGEVDGRTLFFDWVQIMAGVVCGFPLVCQVISVPGQTVLTPRRRHLLSSADVVVLVCDSSSEGVERARDGLRLIDEMTSDRAVPLVLQANRQDQVGALAGAEIARRLELQPAAVIDAIATEGIGVIDTFVNAVRAVSRSIQSRTESGGVSLPVGRAPVPTDLLSRLEKEELDPEWAAEMFLEEVQTSLLMAGRQAFAPGAVETGLLRHPLVLERDADTGFVWPAHTGRAVLEALSRYPVADRTMTLTAEGEGALELGGQLVRTSRANRFTDPEDARRALVRAARERTRFGALLAPDTVLVVQTASDGACWLWSIRPLLPGFLEACKTSPDRREELLRAYGSALSTLIAASLDQGAAVELRPESFGVSGGSVRYTGDVTSARTPEQLAASLSDALDSIARHGWNLAPVLERLEATPLPRIVRPARRVDPETAPNPVAIT